MKMEKFGWFAERAPQVPALPKVDGSLEFLIKADDVSTLEPSQESAEAYRQADGMEKLFGIESEERRSHPSVEYEDMTKAIFGHANVTVMDSRSNESIAPPKHSSDLSLEKRDKKEIYNGSTIEFHGANKWTHFFFNGELVRMRCEGPDYPEPLEFDAQGSLAQSNVTKVGAADLTKGRREMPPIDPQFAHLVKINDDRE
jgi:hypothetical protein